MKQFIALFVSYLCILDHKLELLFLGAPARGEKIPEPTFRSIQATEKPSEHEWFSELKVSLLSHRKPVFFG